MRMMGASLFCRPIVQYADDRTGGAICRRTRRWRDMLVNAPVARYVDERAGGAMAKFAAWHGLGAKKPSMARAAAGPSRAGVVHGTCLAS
jgi:hypothetical protein